MTRLYLIRHGQTEWNVEKKMQGKKNSNLTKLGIEQANKLSKRLSKQNFDYIYSSPLKRAYDTAKIIRGERNIEIIKDENLQEMGFGVWEGRPPEELKNTYPEQYKNFWEKPHLYEPIDGENFKDFNDRVIKSLFSIIQNHKDSEILIVTHTIVILHIMSYFENRELKRMWEPPHINPASLSMVEVNDGSHEIILYGDIEHY